MWQLVLVRLRRRWIVSLALWLGVIVSVGFAGAAALVQTSAADANLQLFLKSQGASGDITVSEADKNDAFLVGQNPNPGQGYKAFQAVVAERAHSLTGGLLTVTGAWVVSDQFDPATINGRGYTNLSSAPPVLAAYDGIDSHMKAVGTSQLPAGDTAVPVAMTEAGAAAMGVNLGDRLCMGETKPQLCILVATLWRPLNPDDVYLAREQVPASAMFVSIDHFYQILSAYPDKAAAAYARLDVDLAAAHGYTAAEVYGRAVTLINGLNNLSKTITVKVGLVGGLTDFVERASIAQFAIQLIASQMLVLALLYVAFASGHVLDQQGQLFAAWRGRGWSSRRVFAVVMTESVLITVLAVPFGLVAAYGVAALISGLVYRTLPFGFRISDLGFPIGIALLVILAMLAVQAIRASRRELLDVRRRVSRPETKPWWQWRYIDLALAILSIPILLQLRTVGQAGLRAAGFSATDPLTTSLPVMGLIFLSVASLRLLPPLARLAGRAGRSLAASMASAQFTRDPSTHVGPALLLSVSIALALFASIYATTVSRSAADRIAYSVGSDIRLSSIDHRPAFDALSAQLSGVQAQSFAYRSFGNVGTSGGPFVDVLGVDPYTMKGMAWSRPGLNSAPLPNLIDRLAVKEQGGMLLGGQPKALTLWVYTTGGLAIDIAASVTDADGQPCDCRFGTQNQVGWFQVTAQLRFARPPTYPLRFRNLTFGAVKVNGTIAISDLQADGSALESFSAPSGWTATDSDHGFYNAPLKAGKSFPRNGTATVAFTLAQSQGNFVVSAPAAPDPIPALASTATLAEFNLVQDQPFIASVSGIDMQFVVVGTADQFPSLYQQNGPWLVVGLDPFLAQLNQGSGYANWPNEAWYAVDPSRDRSDFAVVQHAFPQARVLLDRRDLLAAAASDPLWLGLEANLLFGALTGLALGIAAFALHFLVAAKGRLSEYAVLEGSGLPRSLIWRSLFIEQLVVLTFSLGTGIVLGVLLSIALLPSLQLGNKLLDTVPATVVTINPFLAAAVLAAVTLAAVIAGRLAARTGRGYRLMDELRSL